MTRPAKSKLSTLAELDHRTTSARMARNLIADLTSDLGGSDVVSAAERQIIQRAAITGAILEDMEAQWLAGGQIDFAIYLPLANMQRRQLESIGLKRAPRDVTSLGQILRDNKDD